MLQPGGAPTPHAPHPRVHLKQTDRKLRPQNHHKTFWPSRRGAGNTFKPSGTAVRLQYTKWERSTIGCAAGGQAFGAFMDSDGPLGACRLAIALVEWWPGLQRRSCELRIYWGLSASQRRSSRRLLALPRRRPRFLTTSGLFLKRAAFPATRPAKSVRCRSQVISRCGHGLEPFVRR